MLDKNQEQHVNEQGTAIQAGGNVSLNVTYNGLTRAEAKEIFNELFELNYYKLTGAAQAVAKRRGEEINEKFIEKLQNENPAGLQQYADPDFQDALFTVQKEYAKAGDKDLGDILVDLLVDRSKQANRNILQIVLNESLHTVPKLTHDQLTVLSLVFLLRYVKSNSGNHQLLHDFLSKYIQSLANNIVVSKSCFQHLVFTGCGAISMGQITLEDVFQRTYTGLFKKGCDSTRIDEITISLKDKIDYFFIQCLNDPAKYQVNALDMEILESKFAVHQVSTENQQKIVALFNEGTMSSVEIKAKIVEFSPFMKPIFDAWSASEMKNFELSSVGMAIGHANIKRLAGEFANLSIWIN